MSLEHQDSPRFTLGQRDEILNLAARLQVQHEATVGVDELFAEAIASGIDPRFVQDAAMRLGRKSRPSPMRAPLFLFVLFTLQACVLMAHNFMWFRRGDASLEWPELVVAGGIALLIGLPAAKRRVFRRFVPLAPLVVWLAAGMLTLGLMNAFVGSGAMAWVMPTALTYGFVQAAVALFSVLVTQHVERAPADADSFRLYRGPQA